jgi:hypothetical protein
MLRPLTTLLFFSACSAPYLGPPGDWEGAVEACEGALEPFEYQGEVSWYLNDWSVECSETVSADVGAEPGVYPTLEAALIKVAFTEGVSEVGASRAIRALSEPGGLYRAVTSRVSETRTRHRHGIARAHGHLYWPEDDYIPGPRTEEHLLLVHEAAHSIEDVGHVPCEDPMAPVLYNPAQCDATVNGPLGWVWAVDVVGEMWRIGPADETQYEMLINEI